MKNKITFQKMSKEVEILLNYMNSPLLTFLMGELSKYYLPIHLYEKQL